MTIAAGNDAATPSADAAGDELSRLVAIGEQLIGICDTVGQPVAAAHFSMGVEILRACADLRHAQAAG